MANYNYNAAILLKNLRVLLVQAKAEREKYLQSASDSEISYSAYFWRKSRRNL